jgi:hypothetical protein
MQYLEAVNVMCRKGLFNSKVFICGCCSSGGGEDHLDFSSLAGLHCGTADSPSSLLPICCFPVNCAISVFLLAVGGGGGLWKLEGGQHRVGIICSTLWGLHWQNCG